MKQRGVVIVVMGACRLSSVSAYCVSSSTGAGAVASNSNNSVKLWLVYMQRTVWKGVGWRWSVRLWDTMCNHSQHIHVYLMANDAG